MRVFTLAVLVLTATPALAWETQVDKTPIDILGKPCAIVTTTYKGGPLRGFLGNNVVTKDIYTLNKEGELVSIGSHQSSHEGVGVGMLKGATTAGTAGAFYVWGQAVQPGTQVSTNVAQGQGQGQGQNQGQNQLQGQGQIQGQSQSSINQNYNSNTNNNTNYNKNTSKGGWVPPGHSK